ncbi:TPA: hypothetical protein IUD88_001177 [Enterococcus faecalis]|nr:hypothetical protein [Enterococcus faecalis]HBI2046303.1 hypothetical protein [Enterococcus faecalis]
MEINRMSMEEIRLRQKAIEFKQVSEQESQVNLAFYQRATNLTEVKNEKEFFKYTEPKQIFDSKKAKLSIFGEVATSKDQEKIYQLKQKEELFVQLFGEGRI